MSIRTGAALLEGAAIADVRELEAGKGIGAGESPGDGRADGARFGERRVGRGACELQLGLPLRRVGREFQGLRRFLLATRDAHSLYASFGFEPLKNPENLTLFFSKFFFQIFSRIFYRIF